MDPKKVLIITYYWPPSGGSGVQRWVKFCKYLPEFGWDPIVYTPSNPERPALDPSLLKDIPEQVKVIKQPIWEPYSFYKKFVGLKKEDKLGSGLMKSGKESSILHDLSIWIRGNFFIPDARKFWISPSVKYLTQFLSNNQVDAIITTGPPHSMHMIGLELKKRFDIPWIADFRDPWTNIDFFEDLKLSSFARNKHHRLEQKVLNKADNIVVVSPTMKKEFEELTDKNIMVITNGFDQEDFENKDVESPSNSKFTISHIGMMTATRSPKILWEVLAELKKEVSEFADNFKLELIGKVDQSINHNIEEHHLRSITEIQDYKPHDEIVLTQKKSDALLLIVNDTPNASSILTGKLFEYLAAKRPIICISPVEGDVAKIIKETKSGIFIDYENKDRLKDEILRLYERWKNGDSSFENFKIEKYSRKSLAKTYVDELENLIA